MEHDFESCLPWGFGLAKGRFCIEHCIKSRAKYCIEFLFISFLEVCSVSCYRPCLEFCSQLTRATSSSRYTLPATLTDYALSKFV